MLVLVSWNTHCTTSKVPKRGVPVSMSEKLVLPRFDLPRDTTRIAIRAAWAAGALMVVATLVLGMALWHRRSAQLAAAEQVAARAEAARRAALAPPPAPKRVAASPA